MGKLRSFILVFGVILFLGGCTQNAFKPAQTTDAASGGEQAAIVQAADKLEVYYFHRTQRCISCLTIGEYINKTMMDHYSDEMASGKIDYKEINIDLPESKDLARKFQAGASSLYINAIRSGEDDIENIPEVWSLKGDEQNFEVFLRQKIDAVLGT